MNRKFVNYFEGVVVLCIEGRKIERFLSYLYKLKIDIIDTNVIDRKKVIIKIYNSDLEKVMNMKTTYNIEKIGYEGKLKLLSGIKKHLFLVISLIIGYALLLYLSNVIFEVEVIHSNANIRDLMIAELEERDISKWKFKKNHEGIERIKKEILDEHKERLEWIEIENVGTKYIVKVVERKMKSEEKNYTYQDIVSSKSAIIMKMEVFEGEIVKRKNDFVKKGDVIISGRIMKGNEVSKIVKASGQIYGEVWYNIKVEHPIIYQSKTLTGNEKKIYQIQFLNFGISLFDFSPFKDKKVETTNVLSNPLIPFKIVKELQKEAVIEDEIYTDSEALIKAEEQAVKKMKDSLDEDEYIISKRKLKYYIENNKLYLEMFFKVCEKIGEEREITETE
ncbi:MAG TPA: sporulation protein YqfD [Mollicutes bacterium]|nr:sporulation protein YqfD [Mollicutes bacterium]